MNLRVTWEAGCFLTSKEPIVFSRKTVLQVADWLYSLVSSRLTALMLSINVLCLEQASVPLQKHLNTPVPLPMQLCVLQLLVISNSEIWPFGSCGTAYRATWWTTGQLSTHATLDFPASRRCCSIALHQSGPSL